MENLPRMIRVEWENGDITFEVPIDETEERYILDKNIHGNYWAYKLMCEAYEPFPNLKKMTFIIEFYWDNGETEKYAFIDDTWSGATVQAHTYAKKLDKGTYHLYHESCAFLINN